MRVSADRFSGTLGLGYITSWGLEKLFHAAWWDYSDFPLNLHGRISLFTSMGFGLAGLLVVHAIAPFTENAVGHIIEMDEYPGMYHAFDMIDPDHELSRIAIGRFHRHFAFAVNHYFAPQE